MAPLWVVAAFLTAILAPTSLFLLRQSPQEEICLGSDLARARGFWDYAASQQRELMLAAILIFDGAYRDELLSRRWADLPLPVQSSVAQTMAGIGPKGEMYIGYLD